MPSSAVYYPSSGFWDTAREVFGSGEKRFPLKLAPAHFTLERLYAIRKGQHSRQAMDTADAVATSAYLVDDEPIRETAVFTYFRRLYSTIPPGWSDPLSMSHRYPSVPSSVTFGSVVSSGVSMARDASYRIVVTKASHGLTTSDRVALKFSIGSTTFSNYQTAIVATTTDTFTTTIQAVGSSTLSNTSYQTITGFFGHGVIDREVSADVVHEYVLPGVTAGFSTASDLRPIQPFRVLTSAGVETEAVTSLTIPTAAQWIAAVEAGEKFPVESIVRTYLGNILERVTTYVPYQ